MNTREKGRIGENRAVEYLLGKGYTIVSRNFQTKAGEIDCIAQDMDGTFVFVEVKSARYGSRNPLFSITPSKQKNLIRVARRYMMEHKIVNKPCRFDVIAVVKGEVEHLKNAFISM
ncbi:YraN family protein [Chitinispirillales bacterium ANBcel5]|uniref:YraN family protein n=1 Tax=Cellulosispirillum alkaliphilum TaxID=3039283 RepID=UPI002A4E4327|nr:YraN family protein [Chitinispirillales bacterium ANBcel5]